MTTLSKRMMALADQVSACAVFADIGTDHGFLPIYLVQQNRIQKAIAMDVKEGPLSRAKEHVQKEGLEDKIELRLSDGLEKLEPGEANAIMISGMGGPLMERILSKGQSVATEVEELILQPQSEIKEFRQFLVRRGYKFLSEDIVLEEGKYYFIMKVAHLSYLRNGEGFVPTEEEEFTYGGLLIQQKNPTLYEYLSREKSMWEETYHHLLDQEESENISERMEEIKEKISLIEKTMKRMEG
ncbi:MAG: class I SAM-dependent methyltransferase [Lachnospiraceae bacterium]|nr:class I SAM-dependent methyltransferase [Lachnospiraceae bacterium]